MATDTTRTTEKSYWEKTRKRETKSLRCCLNAVNDEAEVTRSGSVFQMRAPAAGKAREPMKVNRTANRIRSSEVEGQSL